MRHLVLSSECGFQDGRLHSNVTTTGPTFLATWNISLVIKRQQFINASMIALLSYLTMSMKAVEIGLTMYGILCFLHMLSTRGAILYRLWRGIVGNKLKYTKKIMYTNTNIHTAKQLNWPIFVISCTIYLLMFHLEIQVSRKPVIKQTFLYITGGTQLKHIIY